MRGLDHEASILRRQRAVADLQTAGDPLRLAHAIRHLGDAYYYAGRIDLAEPHYLEALSIYRGRDDYRPLDLANAIRSLAVIKGDLGADQEAISLWQEAHDLYWSEKVPAGVAESAARLALLARRQNDLSRSKEWLAQAIAAAEVAGDSETLQFAKDIAAQLSADE